MNSLNKKPLYDQVYHLLRHDIMSGAYKPGEIVTIRSISRKLEMSEMPIREALRRLISEYALEMLPNRAVRVPVLNRKCIEEILELRVVLEGLAASKAANNVTEANLKRVEAAQRAAEKSLSAVGKTKYLAHNYEFHRRIYEAADSETLVAMIENLWLRYAPIMSIVFENLFQKKKEVNSIGQRNHEDIIQALKERDPVCAAKAVKQDIIDITNVDGYWRLAQYKTESVDRRGNKKKIEKRRKAQMA